MCKYLMYDIYDMKYTDIYRDVDRRDELQVSVCLVPCLTGTLRLVAQEVGVDLGQEAIRPGERPYKLI